MCECPELREKDIDGARDKGRLADSREENERQKFTEKKRVWCQSISWTSDDGDDRSAQMHTGNKNRRSGRLGRTVLTNF